jgi:hypothetical protein
MKKPLNTLIFLLNNQITGGSLLGWIEVKGNSTAKPHGCKKTCYPVKIFPLASGNDEQFAID